MEGAEPVVKYDASPKDLKVLSSETLKKRTKQLKQKGKRKPYLPNLDNKKNLKQIGESAEECVMKYLINHNYANIYKASDDNEGLHYDIRFTDENGNVKFIEVKSFDNGKFHLSKSQYDFGQDNHEDYEIWLVIDNKDIIPIKDFYVNAKYDAIVSEYVVYLELE